jgi:hypothetical protein
MTQFQVLIRFSLLSQVPEVGAVAGFHLVKAQRLLQKQVEVVVAPASVVKRRTRRLHPVPATPLLLSQAKEILVDWH